MNFNPNHYHSPLARKMARIAMESSVHSPEVQSPVRIKLIQKHPPIYRSPLARSIARARDSDQSPVRAQVTLRIGARNNRLLLFQQKLDLAISLAMNEPIIMNHSHSNKRVRLWFVLFWVSLCSTKPEFFEGLE